MHINDDGLYQDDGLMVEQDRRRENDNIREKLFKLFKRSGFDIKIETNLKIIQYLDIELDLINESVAP